MTFAPCYARLLLVRPHRVELISSIFALSHVVLYILFLKEVELGIYLCYFQMVFNFEDTHDFLFVNKRAGASGEELA